MANPMLTLMFATTPLTRLLVPPHPPAASEFMARVLLSHVALSAAFLQSPLQRPHTLRRTWRRITASSAASSGADNAKLQRLSLERTADDKIAYTDDFRPMKLACEELVWVPHGRTPANERLIFQSHEEGPDGQLLPESLEEAEAGARQFFEEYGEMFARIPGKFTFVRSPLQRTADTAAVYHRVAVERFGPEIAFRVEPSVDDALIEIDHASWHGKTAAELEGVDANAAAYREGSFFAKPANGGESNLDLMDRCYKWLDEVANKEHAGQVLVVFGHGTFQNAAETLVCPPYVTPPVPAKIFTRKAGESHLKRGYPHKLYSLY